MSNATATRPARQRTKPARFARLIRTLEGDVLVIRQKLSQTREQVDTYRALVLLPECGGRGVELVKEDGVAYHVLLNGAASTCDCKGFEKHGHCKHVESLLALEARPAPLPAEAPPVSLADTLSAKLTPVAAPLTAEAPVAEAPSAPPAVPVVLPTPVVLPLPKPIRPAAVCRYCGGSGRCSLTGRHGRTSSRCRWCG